MKNFKEDWPWLMTAVIFGFFLFPILLDCHGCEDAPAPKISVFRTHVEGMDQIIFPLYLTQEEEKIFKPGDVVWMDPKTKCLVNTQSDMQDFMNVVIEKRIIP